LAKREISPDSHRAVHEGRISLGEARELGRNAGPAGPAVRVDKDDRTPERTPTFCLCGCGVLVARTFASGHDMRMFRIAREHILEGRDLTDEQREYLEVSGKMQKVRERLEAEEQKRQERITAKTERQRAREGEAEKRKARAAALSEPGDSEEEEA
jgi:Na+-translocating ferredoxin:NAD+ oxidoreductase RnfC subunit